MASNRGVVYVGPGKVEVRSIDFPKLVDPRGRRCDHGVILKVVSTNICGSDQHMVRDARPRHRGWCPGTRLPARSSKPGATLSLFASARAMAALTSPRSSSTSSWT